MSGARQFIYGEIEAERQYQDIKWGGPDHDDEHSSADFFRFIEQRWMRAWKYGARKTFVQIAALAVAAIESLDRRFPAPPVEVEGKS